MGWTFVNKSENVLDFFKKEMEFEDENRKASILKKSGIYYAFEILNKETEIKKVMGVVIKTVNVPNPSEYYNFGYKVIDEDMGPSDRKCPKSILKLLTPTNSEYANEWRKDCWKNVNKKEENKKKLEVGDIIKFKNPLTSTSGRTLVYFQKIFKRKLLFREMSKSSDGSWTYGYMVRLNRNVLNPVNWEIVEKTDGTFNEKMNW